MKLKIKEWQIRWTGIPLVAFIAHITSPEGHYFIDNFWINYFHSLVFTAVYWNGAMSIFYYFRRRFPEASQTAKRLPLTFISLTLFVSLAPIPVRLVLGYTTIQTMFDLQDFWQVGIFSGAMTLIIGGMYEAVYFFEKWRDSIKVTEELKSQQIKTQFAVLQNQMSPHFLFNSLNTLTTLIAENQETAIQFTQKLSEVYRYILSNKNRELVSLEEELDFAKSYVFLLQMRYPDNLSVEFDIEEHYLSTHIAPLTLQMLIENAIKHNEVSRKRPLTISIYVDRESSIIVENNLQIKSSLGESTKTGLSNIRKRYNILADREIMITNSDSIFRVSVPIINLMNHENKLVLES